MVKVNIKVMETTTDTDIQELVDGLKLMTGFEFFIDAQFIVRPENSDVFHKKLWELESAANNSILNALTKKKEVDHGNQ